MRIKYGLLIISLLIILVNAQVENSISIELKINTVGDRAKVFETRLNSYLTNELMKIPDVKLAQNSKYLLYVHIFELPCDYNHFTFYYRSHFINRDLSDEKFTDSYSPTSEGFRNYKQIEDLAKDIVVNLNVNYLSVLRD